ncbi:MAG: molecular chaperone DnaJ [Rhodobacterales bacterium]|nr:MAG: molecular chaperone DnaJ [Rhodobacterales bacterium]
MGNTPYDALGVDQSASDAQIKKAYRKIAKDCHPDLNPGDPAAEAKFKAASAAYDFLKDPEQRRRYDAGEIDATGAEKQPERRFYREYAEQPGHGYGSTRGYEDFGDMSDLFADILRQRQQQGANGYYQSGMNARGPDMRYVLEIDFMTAAKGGKKPITLPSGDNLQVTIPEGTADGQVIRLRGKGGEGYGTGKRGDAYVSISVKPHKQFRREGNDIFITLPISLNEAVLGGKVATPTIHGKVNLSIPKGASSGQTLRLRGRGIKRGGKAGDQMVELRIVMPDKIDSDLENFMQGWARNHSYNPRKGVV